LKDLMNSFYEAWKLLASFDMEVYGIILLSLAVTLLSTGLAALLALPLGIILGTRSFVCKKLILRIIHTLMGLPPVVAGLIVYVTLSRKGPLGGLSLLFTPTAMVIAQVIIIIPIITGLTVSAVQPKSSAVLETCRGLGIGGWKALRLLLHECRYSIYSAILAGYGRAISEVGAVMLVGGNIRHHTRVMTTAIVLETGKGNYSQALALGLILIALSFLINWLLQHFQEGT
jgi:tungstate transport system permease protein